MLLESLGEKARAHFGGQLLDHGASRVLLRVENGAGLAEKIVAFLGQSPWRHFRFGWGMGADPAAARAAAEAMQPDLWTFAPCEPIIGAHGPDPLDGLRPATETETGPDGQPRRLSTATLTRRQVGRTNRPQLFSGDDRAPPHDLAEIVANPPAHVAEVVRRKLAVVVADGVGFGKTGEEFRAAARARLARAPAPATGEADPAALARLAWADALAAMRARLARRIEGWAAATGLEYDRDVPHPGKTKRSAKVDVLIWGGDDMTFVLPATHVFPFLEMFFDEMAKPFAPGIVESGLPHRVGVIVAQVKTPIRQMRALAKESQKLVRDWLGNQRRSAFAIDVYESSPLAYDGVAGYRRALYGPDMAPEATAFAAEDLGRLKAFFAGGGVAQGSGAGLSTTQVHRTLQGLRAAGLRLTDATDAAKAQLRRHIAARDGGEPPFADWIAGFSERPRLLPVLLAEAAQLEPYVRAGWAECRAPEPAAGAA